MTAPTRDERIALHVQKILADLPPLTEEQKREIAYLLSGHPARRLPPVAAEQAHP